MNEPSEIPLRWSSQLKVSSADLTRKLQGDKIILPPSALEQLLAAATVTVVSNGLPGEHTSTFDPFNHHSFAAELHARAQLVERHQQLPQPLTFRLVNPVNGNVAYAGIREFSANEEEVGISSFLRQALGIDEDGRHSDVGEELNLTVHASQLPKGTYVRFRPLEAGYDPEDWKALLERHLRNTFTTITNGEILGVPSGKEEYRFLVDKILPDGDGICIVDTDLEVDIEALNEEQARETLKRRLEKNKNHSGSPENSPRGDIAVGKEVIGSVGSGDYVDYTLKEWDRTKGIEVEVIGDHSGFVDIFLSPLSSRQRVRPRADDHVFGDMSERPTKKVRIQHSNTELEKAESLYISVRGFEPVAENEGKGKSVAPPNMQYSLRITYESTSIRVDELPGDEDLPPSPNEIRCKNCLQWVPQRTMMLHENFCFRNNVLCPHCKEVFKKSSSAWQNHWHCPHDDSHGDAPSSKAKHDSLYHLPRTCPTCGYQAKNTPDLAHHRTSTCPSKIILCQFCHLLVPQQGPDDLDATDPEVILSDLTPHELSDGSRTTECHMCGKIVRLRDMSTHLKHHDLERLVRITPRTCRNANCGRTLDGVGPRGEIKRPKPSRNDIGLCDACYGPLYNSSFDPDGKALKRRVERKYLSQLLTGCGKDWCRNTYCKTGAKYLSHETPGEPVTSKVATAMIKPVLADLMETHSPLAFCTDEASQKRRVLAEMVAAQVDNIGVNAAGYDLPWCIAALEAESGDLDQARTWLRMWAPTKAETSR